MGRVVRTAGGRPRSNRCTRGRRARANERPPVCGKCVGRDEAAEEEEEEGEEEEERKRDIADGLRVGTWRICMHHAVLLWRSSGRHI
jgi:hypothetical protein